MKEIKLKITTAMMLAAMLLAGCGESASSPQAGGGPAAPQAETEAVTETTEPEYPHLDTSSLDFGGKTISFISPEWGTHRYQYAEELDGDIVNDAAYNRMVDLENSLNVKMAWTWSTDAETHNVVKKSVQAGDDAYQIVYTHCIYGISDYATAGALYNIYDLPHIDLEAPWWDLDMMKSFQIGSRLHYVAGDLLLQGSTLAFFNKRIAKDFGLPDHYQLVRDGLWTYDRFIEYASSVTLDINGDGVIDRYDQTGYTGDLTERTCDIPFFCGEHCTKMGENGIELVYWSDKIVDIFNKTYKYFLDPSVSNGYFRFYSENNQGFEEDLALYTLSTVSGIAGMREYEVDFGVIPGFKYNEEQESYYSYCWPCFVCVPTTITDPELTGACLEQYCYKSTELQTAYNEVLIRGKSTRDVESLEMLDLVNSVKVCDIGASYLGFDSSFHKIFYCFYELMPEKKDNIASHYEKALKGVDKALTKLYDKIMEAENA